MDTSKLKIMGGPAQWETAWNQVKLGDTVIAARPGSQPVKFEVIVRVGGDGSAPAQIAGGNTVLYSYPGPLQIIGRALPKRRK